ncbi:MAG: hypothetical protein KAY32_09840 [Candidatus Eisenbacteria sp.]|nr:hypothetical protein [Candidatus Eisenbacteria bacterium]
MKMSEVRESLASVGEETLACRVRDVRIDADFRGRPELPLGWRGLIESKDRVRPLTHESVTTGREAVILFQPDQGPELGHKGWLLGFEVPLVAPEDKGTAGWVVACEMEVRLRDPRPLTRAFPGEQGQWTAADLERLIGNLMQNELRADVAAGALSIPSSVSPTHPTGAPGDVSGAPRVIVSGHYASGLLNRLDPLFLSVGVAILGIELTLRPAEPMPAKNGSRAAAQEAVLEMVTVDVPIRFQRSRTERVSDLELRLGALEVQGGSRGPADARWLRLRKRRGGPLERVRRIREVIAQEAQEAGTLCRDWAARGDRASAGEAQSLGRELDALVRSLRDVVPEMTVGGRRPSRQDQRAWFEKYERCFAEARALRTGLEEAYRVMRSGGGGGERAVRALREAAVSLEQLGRMLRRTA